MAAYGVIAGSGLYDMPGLEITDEKSVATPYGAPSDVYRIGRLSGRDVVFLPRHGSPHRIAPHKINYRANIWGFRELGVERIISVGATGGISPAAAPGSIMVLDQILDLSSGRDATYFDRQEVVHVDFTEPFCGDLRAGLLCASAQSGVQVAEGGTYVCVNGPRLETAAEIRMFAAMGGDVVGMTGMPEAVLARELALCFAAVAVVTNAAAGISTGRLTATEVKEGMHAAAERIKLLLAAFFGLPDAGRTCACRSMLGDAKL